MEERLCGDRSAARPVWLKIYATNFKTRRLLGYFDLPVDEKREVELFATIEQGELLEIKPYDTNYDHRGRGLWGNDAETYAGRGIAVEWVEVEGPLVASWPPPSVARLVGDLEVKPIESRRNNRRGPAFTIEADAPRSAVEDVLHSFASRAFRRPVTPAEVERYVKLADQALDDGRTLEDALRMAFRAVLTSPRFLFIEERPGKLDDWALASRLSYFPSSTCPDDELREFAASGVLHQPDILRGQVERLLDSPRAAAFVENFTGQWLELRQIDFTHPDRKLYPSSTTS